MNREGIPGSIGRPLPHFQVALLDAQGQVVAAKGTGEGTGEAVGEIALRADPPGLLTPGYLDDPQATAAAFRHGWFLTGDLARRDAAGHLIFAGRAKEAIRRRGENVSALEIETVIAAYLAIEECAVLGVPAEIGEEEILAVVTLRPGQTLRPEALLDWLSERLAPHQKPRYLRIVATLPRTPSERIAKAEISRDIRADWDAEAK